MNITDNELAVLKAIRDNYYQGGETPVGYPVWSDHINDSHSPSGIEGKALSGVVSTLAQKGLVVSEQYSASERTVKLTSEGLAAIGSREENAE